MDAITDRIKKVGGESARKLARMLDMKHTSVQEYLNGRVPSVEFVVRMCKHFDVDPWWLMTGEEKISVVAEPATPYPDNRKYPADLAPVVDHLEIVWPSLCTEQRHAISSVISAFSKQEPLSLKINVNQG